MEPTRTIPTGNTIMQRHLAAIFDNILAAIGGLLAAKTLVGKDHYQIQLVIFVVVYLAYFLRLN